MAAWHDLAPRLSRIQAAGLSVVSDYKSSPAQWLAAALEDCDVRIFNCKGIAADETPVLITLSTLEALIAASPNFQQATGD